MNVERRNGWLFAATAALVFAADQLSKAWAAGALDARAPWRLAESFFWLTLVRNPHGAFGLFAGWAGHYRSLLLMGLPAVSVVFFAWYYLRHGRSRLSETLAFGFIVGGAAGNLLDRALHGYVVDFLDFHWQDRWHWPAFNLADSAVTVGAALLIAGHFLESRPAPEDAPHAPQAS